MENPKLKDLFERAEKLKSKIERSKNILKDENAQQSEKELRDLYRSILLCDLDYALERNVHVDLWTKGFKVTMDLRRKNNEYFYCVRNPQDPNAWMPESQRLLRDCLTLASEFYKKLLVEICATFDFDVPSSVRDILKLNPKTPNPGKVPLWEEKGYKKPDKRSCLLMCQNCLTHIGDCVRYYDENKKAYPYYCKAIEMSQLSGHTHNQIGLLHSYEGNLLSCVYHYVRGIATCQPYLKARDNMLINLSERADGQMGKHGNVSATPDSLPTARKYVCVFLLLIGRLRMGNGSFTVLSRLVKLLTCSLKKFAKKDAKCSETLSSRSLYQMFAICVFVLEDARNGFGPLVGTPIFKSNPQLTRKVVLDLIAGSLYALLRSVHHETLKDILCHKTLPTIKLTLDWIRTEPSVLKEEAFQSRPEMWSILCNVLNKFADVQKKVVDNEEIYRSIPLPEDREFEGFTILQPAVTELRFVNKLLEEEPHLDDTYNEEFVRARRLLKFGQWLAKRKNIKLITIADDHSHDPAIITFAPVVEATAIDKPKSPSGAKGGCDSSSSSDDDCRPVGPTLHYSNFEGRATYHNFNEMLNLCLFGGDERISELLRGTSIGSEDKNDSKELVI